MQEKEHMTFDEYQQRALATAIYPREAGIVYPVLGLAGESGEVADKVKKTIRDHDGVFDQEVRIEIAKEAGDVLWYLAALARELGMSLEDIAGMNIEKISSRSMRGKLHGSGDNR